MIREAVPLPGSTGANASILRKLLGLQVNLLKAEITAFAASLLPVLLDVRDEIVSRLVSIVTKRGPTLRASQLVSLEGDIESIIGNAAGEIGGKFGDELDTLAASFAKDTHKAITSSVPKIAAGVFSPLNAEEIENSVARFGSGFADWINNGWTSGSEDLAKQALTNSVAFGEDSEEAAQRMAQALGTSIEKARLVSRTAIHANAADIRDQYLDENSDVFDKWMWVATLDHRTCPKCGPLDGKLFDIKQGPEIPAHMRCRCVAVPQVTDWSDTGLDMSLLPPGQRASMNGEVPSTMTYSDWLDQQEAAEGRAAVLAIVGKHRLEAHHRGVELSFAADYFRWQKAADGRVLQRRKWNL